MFVLHVSTTQKKFIASSLSNFPSPKALNYLLPTPKISTSSTRFHDDLNLLNISLLLAQELDAMAGKRAQPKRVTPDSTLETISTMKSPMEENDHAQLSKPSSITMNHFINSALKSVGPSTPVQSLCSSGHAAATSETLNPNPMHFNETCQRMCLYARKGIAIYSMGNGC